MDPTYKGLFFEAFKEKFLKDLEFLDQHTFYKVLWAFVKSDAVKVNDSGNDWIIIKEAIIKKVKDFEP
jgi:hypothetical protein